jgi:hypothetical protein
MKLQVLSLIMVVSLIMSIAIPLVTSTSAQGNIQDQPSFQSFLTNPSGNLQIPKTIRVRITGNADCDPSAPYTVQVMDFKEYVKHVLPNEFYPSQPGQEWSDEAYRAGAVAVKMYAWYWIEYGGKWSDADVFDSTCDQVYIPDSSRQITDRAVEYTWNWVLRRDEELFQTSHKQSEINCTPGYCLSQQGAQDLAVRGYTWDKILHHYYSDTQLNYAGSLTPEFSLFFTGATGRVKREYLSIPLTGSANPLASLGDGDFTIEAWLMADNATNLTSSKSIDCGDSQDWIYGNVLFDRYLPDQGRSFGLSLSDGRLLLGVTGETLTDTLTLCGHTSVTDGFWHHIAVQRQRSDGQLWLFVDGKLDAWADGPDGDLSITDTISLTRETDSFLGIGAWKLGGSLALHPPFRGWLDEIRISDILRYSDNFTPSSKPFLLDDNTLTLYHFDEGLGQTAQDASSPKSTTSNGLLILDSSHRGLEWWPSGLFRSDSPLLYSIPLVIKP